MEFTFVTDYDQKAFTILAKVLRKTSHRTLSIIFRTICVIFAVMLLLEGFLPALFMYIEGETMRVEYLRYSWVDIFFILVVIVHVFFGDYSTGFWGRKRMQPGTEKSTTVFSAECYTVISSAAKTEFRYNGMLYIAETTDYFVFVMGKNHGLIFSKSSISGGTVEEFRRFIEERTNKKLLRIKG